MLFNVNDTGVGKSMDAYGEWAEGELSLLTQLIKPGFTVIDVGANIGSHTIFFAKAVTPSGCVLSFEPQRLVYQTLCANVALNSLRNVHTFHAAAGSERKVITVRSADPTSSCNFGGVSLLDSPQGDIVTMLPLDELPITRCDLIKIDVEGMELEVLKGAQALISSQHPSLYLENNSKERSGALIDHLLKLGFNLYWHFSPFFNESNFFRNPENVFGRILDINLLAISGKAQGLLPVEGPGDTPDEALRRASR